MLVKEAANAVDNRPLFGAGNVNVVFKLIGEKTFATADNGQARGIKPWDKVGMSHGNRLASIRPHVYVEEISVEDCAGRADGGMHAK